MCGFAGEFVFAGQADRGLAMAMAAKLTHRGPDEAGSFLSADKRCAIGFRRLAVIDPTGSRQPMTDPGGRVTVAFNGEIYNFRQLRPALASGGWVFRTEGDTEVLLAEYCQCGEQMLDRLVGMFAVAVYDSAAGRLLLARDRLGEKPLWYAALADRIIFASEAKALLVHPAVAGKTDLGAVTRYLTIGYISAPQTAWLGVRKLEAGSTLAVGGPAVQARRYWQPRRVELPKAREDVVAVVRESVTRAVQARMVSDVPLGALLSGGLDSSIVVALMSRTAGRSGGVRTFTAGFADRTYDERPAARLVAEHCGTEHTELLVRADPGESVDAIVRMYDEPFADSSALATWLICRAARESVTVALGGDGGDEVFGGYDRYRALRLAETMGKAAYLGVRVVGGLARPFARGGERSGLQRLVRFAEALPQPFAMQYFMHRRLFGPADLGRLLTDEFAEGVDLAEPEGWFCGLYETGEFDSEVIRAQRHDLLTYLPDDLLVKTDIASMACSLELRAPLLDHELVNLGLSLPVDLKVGRRRGKLILREAFADMLPAEVLVGPKRGFGLPVGRWLREDLQPMLRDVLLGPDLRGMKMFREEALAGLINDHVLGRDDHSHRLWALLVLGRWLIEQQ